MKSTSDLRNRKAATTVHSTTEEQTTTPALTTNKDNSNEDVANTRTSGYRLVPLRERPVFLRLDVGPFLFAYLCLVGIDLSTTNPILGWLVELAFPILLFSHTTLFFVQQWKVSVRATVGYYTLNEISQTMTHSLVLAPQRAHHPTSHEAGIVPAIRQSDDTILVRFRDVVFRAPLVYSDDDADVTMWQEEKTAADAKPSDESSTKTTTRFFHRLVYPIHLPLSFYRQWNGHVQMESLLKARQVYGSNTTPIELPPFLELLQEQTVAPFFLFQVFCVILWSLDEYWYYAMYTLFALLLFESTVAYQRLMSLQRIRSHTIRHDRHIFVYRPSFPLGTAAWTQILVSELVPGDIVSCRVLGQQRGQRNLSQQQLKLWNRIPADILILDGDAVVDEAMLTGESIPQLKGSLRDSLSQHDVALDLQEHKEHVLFCGTTLLVGNAGNDNGPFPPSPDHGVVGMVLRTGFDTAQGSLLRTMVHTQKSVDGVHTQDTYLFILALLGCAVASAAMVLMEGWSDPNRNRFRLVLHVIIIVTSVVPPELPMELSLAVTNSVSSLLKDCHVYCTEAFRIPLAGQVTVCCFDKTGTLTSDEMQLVGVQCAQDSKFSEVFQPSTSLPWPVLRVMAACHSLALSGGGTIGTATIVGDPLEKAVVQDTGYQLVQNNALRATDEQSDRPRTLLILRRFRFSSKLKRMSVLMRESMNNSTWALSKGAPEILKEFLDPNTIPSDYDTVAKSHMQSGKRVLALAYKKISQPEGNGAVNDIQREEVEKDMILVGFLLLDCPLKADSKPVVSELCKSSHSCVMITGDALLTATSVAKQVGILKSGKGSPVLYEFRQVEGSMDNLDKLDFEFVAMTPENGDEVVSLPPLSKANLKEIQQLVVNNKAAVCLSGENLDRLCQMVLHRAGSAVGISIATNEQQRLFHPAVQDLLKQLVPSIAVFARHAPRQKEAIIAAFNASGEFTLMCGDGTNDVGALRRAHVGISLISAPEIEAKHRHASNKIRAEQKRLKKGGKNKKSKQASSLQESLRQLQEAQEELEGVDLGDASIASPFTARTISIKCCRDVLQQGRCTLVTMLQIYKILGVNCLVNATGLSKLYLHGVKNGDRQLVVLGLGVASLFFFVTRGKPLKTLSGSRPPTSVLCLQAVLSIGLQFAVHFGMILLAAQVALHYVDPYDPSMVPDAAFNPNILNTCTFLVTSIATVNTFAVNYRGEPFSEPLRKNLLLFRSLQVCYVILFACSMEVFPPLNDLLQLSRLPSESEVPVGYAHRISHLMLTTISSCGFPIFISGLMALDTLLAFGVEHGIRKLYES
eukprot:Nitzschia sp. Nitz4//scaffold23_size168460//129375//133401//NITZ4_002242-RA/size168460-augustus-gene-0.49-mRNA-1//1//CDS//3329543704//2390//frame0